MIHLAREYSHMYIIRVLVLSCFNFVIYSYVYYALPLLQSHSNKEVFLHLQFGHRRLKLGPSNVLKMSQCIYIYI